MTSYTIKAPIQDIRTALEWVGNTPGLVTSPDACINIMDFNGADPTGTVDSTVAMSNARAAARAAGGGVILYPPGTFLSGNQDISKDVGIYHVGSGKGATTIKLKNGANSDLFSAQTNLINLGAAFGAGVQGTLYNFGFANMTLDGNKTGQTAGPSYPLRFYGYSYIMQNLEIKNGYSGNALSDWNVFNTFAPADSMETQWINVKTHDSNGIGIQYGGPHDSQFINVIPFNEGSHCLHVAPNAPGCQFSQLHAWQPGAGKVAALVEAAGTYWANCQAESSDTVQVVVLGSGFEWVGGNVFGASPFTCTGFQIGQQAGQTPYAGQILQSAGVTTAYNPTNCRIHSRISNCQGSNGAIWLANDGGANRYDVTIDQSSGNTFTGTMSATSNANITTFGLTADGTQGKGGLFRFAGNSFNAFIVSDGTNDILNVNTNGKEIRGMNGAYVRNYSDQGSTMLWELGADAAGSFRWSGDANAILKRLGSGVMGFTGSLATAQSATAPVLATSGTIATAATGVSRVAPAGAVTGVILAAGSQAGQLVTVINESAAANTITFNTTPGTSNVADAATEATIPGLTARTYIWDSSTSRWYRCN